MFNYAICVAVVCCFVQVAVSQFSGGFPFNIIPGLSTLASGGFASGVGMGGSLGQGLGFGGQQGQGWKYQPVAMAAPVQNTGWGSRPVAMAAPVQSAGWGSRPATVFQAPAQHAGWGSQPVVLQTPVVRLQPTGWGSNAAEKNLPSTQEMLPTSQQEGNNLKFDFSAKAAA